MIGEPKAYSFVGRIIVGATFGDICTRFADIADRASRAFRTMPEMRQFQLHLAAALRQASLRPAVNAAEIRQACEAFLIATEQYLAEVEASRSHVVPGPFRVARKINDEPHN